MRARPLRWAGGLACAAVSLVLVAGPSAAASTSPISAATHAAGFTHNQLYTFPGTSVPPQWGVYDSTGEATTTDARSPSYVTASGGLLHVKASGAVGSGLCLCAGGAEPTKPYGRWDVYASLPVDAHHDFGILLWPNPGQAHAGQEIDIAEFPGPSKLVLQNTVHMAGGNAKHSNFTNGHYAGYSKFSVIWTATGVTFWVNDTQVWQTDSTFAPTDTMHLVLQGGIYSKSTPTTGTSQMDVKAVRYFHS